MSFRITPVREPKKILESTSTIDAAIDRARKLSKLGRDVVIRDGDRVRVWARAGRATWVTTCTNEDCEGGYMKGGMYPAECGRCKGYGFNTDLDCQ